MTQEQLDQVYADILLHGRHVEGWSCEQDGHKLVLRDNKRQNTWERSSSDTPWVEEGGLPQ